MRNVFLIILHSGRRRNNYFPLGGLLLLLGAEVQVVGGEVTEVLLHVVHQGPGDKFVHVLGHEEHVEALLLESLVLGELGQSGVALARGEIDVLLLLGHGLHIFLQGDKLLLLGRPEEQQILQGVLVHPVVGDDAVFELTAKGGEELLIVLPAVLLHVQQLLLDLLL